MSLLPDCSEGLCVNVTMCLVDVFTNTFNPSNLWALQISYHYCLKIKLEVSTKHTNGGTEG